MITFYFVPNCFHCKDAKKKLNDNNVPFDEIEADANTIDYLSTRVSQLSMPIIFFDDEVVTVEQAIEKYNTGKTHFSKYTIM